MVATVSAGPNTVVGFNIQNAGAGTLDSGIATLAQTFKQGDLPANQPLTAVINGQTVAVQMDVKTRYEDGSVKMAVLSVERPALSAGASIDVTLLKGAATTGPAVDLAKVSAAHSVTVKMTMADGQKINVDVMDALRDALADGTASFWQKGALATQARIEIDLPGSQRLKFDVTAFKDGEISVDAMFNNDGAMAAAGGRVDYSVVVRMDGKTVVNERVSQAQYQNWHAEFASDDANGSQGSGDPSAGWLNVRHDVAYLQQTGAVAEYDLSIPVNGGLLESYGSAIGDAGWGEPLAANGVTQYMPMTGGRGDIGQTTLSNTAWLMSQDARAAAYSMGQADASGAIPWNFWDSTNGTWLSLDDYPRLWTDPRGGTGAPGDAQSGTLTQGVASDTGWTVELAHHPSLSSVPYLLTGERWILDNLQAQAAAVIAGSYPGTREDEGLVVNGSQVRASAWSLRDVDNAAYLSPDGTPEQAYFQKIADANWNWLVSKIPEWTAEQGEAHGWVPGTNGGPGLIGPWQQDYFATTTIAAAARGNADALAFLEWQANFLLGRFLNQDVGLNLSDGVAYQLTVSDAKGTEPLEGNVYKTWAEIASQMELKGYSLGDAWSTGDNYPQYAAATVAAIYLLTGSSQARDVYELLLAAKARAVDVDSLSGSPGYAVTIPELIDRLAPGAGSPGSSPGTPTTPSEPQSPTPETPKPEVPEPETPTPPEPPSGPAVTTPQTITLGTGEDTLVLKLSQDFLIESAQYTVSVNGIQIGGILTAGALRSSGSYDVLTLRGNWGETVDVAVSFLNDEASSVGDRNLYVHQITLNDVEQNKSAVLYHTGQTQFSLANPAPSVELPPVAAARVLLGSAAVDRLAGGAGNDILRGNGGSDIMAGGAGADTFVVTADSGQDRITDFVSGTDRILFHGIDPASVKATSATVGGSSGLLLTYGSGTDSVFLAGVKSLKNGDLVFSDPPTPEVEVEVDVPVASATASIPSRYGAASLSFGTGADVLTLRVSQDFWEGAAQYTLMVNGQQYGGIIKAVALHGSGVHDAITLRGDWGVGSSLKVAFVNDAWGGSADRDRNLHIEGMSLNGHELIGMTATPVTNGTTTFSVTKPIEARTIDLGHGADTLVMKLSQDYWQGSAQYTISVNGKQIGGTLTAGALRSYDAEDTVTLHGDWGDTVNVKVSFLNDAWSGSLTADRNLHVESISLNGVDMQQSIMIGTTGSKSFLLSKQPGLPSATYAALLEGTDGADTLAGGAGADLLQGNRGNDRMTGGAEADTFLIRAGDGADTITDFMSGTDRVIFTDIDASSLKAVSKTIDGTTGLLITYGTDGDSLFLAGVTKLAAGDLVFG